MKFKTPATPETAEVRIEKLREYAEVLEGDRDALELDIKGLMAQIKDLCAENAKLRAGNVTLDSELDKANHHVRRLITENEELAHLRDVYKSRAQTYGDNLINFKEDRRRAEAYASVFYDIKQILEDASYMDRKE